MPKGKRITVSVTSVKRSPRNGSGLNGHPPRPLYSTIMSSQFPLLEEQFAGAAGLYATDLALIRLGRDESYWAEGNDPTLDRLAVFVHEYAHYLHNFSTVAGIYGFVTSLRRFRLFANTVDDGGRSHGSVVLKTHELAEYQGTVRFRTHLAGALTVTRSLRVASNESLEILGWTFHDQRVDLASQAIDLRGVSIQVRAGSPNATMEEAFELGSHVLSESLAWEMERILFEAQGAELSALDRVSVWPYKFARFFLEQVTGGQVESSVVAKIALLALQSTDPGVAFVDLAAALRDRGNRSPADIVEVARQQFVSDVTRIQTAMVTSLRKEAEPFQLRTSLYRAFTSLIETAAQLLSLRLQQAFFELNAIARQDGTGLVEMIKSFPPCPIIHLTDAGEEIFYLSDAEPDPTAATNFGVAQAALQFAVPHYGPSEILPTTSVRPTACRFFGSCRAPQAMQASECCRERPWESFDPTHREQCWYGQGVAVTRSLPLSNARSGEES
jgi:hypothetical protein